MFLSKRSNGIYYLWLDDENGRKRKVSTHCTVKSDALRFLRTFSRESPKPFHKSPNHTSLALFTSAYSEYANGRYARSYCKNIAVSLNSLKEVVGDVSLTYIGVREVEKFLARIGPGKSDRTVRAYFVTVASAFETAIRWGLLESNPFRKVKRPRLRELIPAHLTPVEFAAVLKVEPDRDLRDLYTCAVSTGMRLGELAALDWHDVDFDQRVIRVRNTATFTTKNRRNRTIPMTCQLCALLAERQKVTTTSHVFSFEGRRITKDIASRNFKQCVVKAGLNPAIHFHSMRHSFATWLVQSEVSLYTVQRLLGHSSIAMTQVYSHLSPSDMHDAVGVISLPVAVD